MEQKAPQAPEAYEKPKVVDYGSLRELTANGRHGHSHNFFRRGRRGRHGRRGGFSFS